LGNKFLTHIREVDAMVQVVRCFEDADIHHVAGAIDPVRDIETIFTELVLSDLEAVRKRREKGAKDAKRGDKVAIAEAEVLAKLEPHLDTGKPAITLDLTPEEKVITKGFYLLTDKPTIFAANVKEIRARDRGHQPVRAKVREYARNHIGLRNRRHQRANRSDLVDLPPDEAKEFLEGTRCVRIRHRRLDSQHLSSAGFADLFHGG